MYIQRQNVCVYLCIYIYIKMYQIYLKEMNGTDCTG